MMNPHLDAVPASAPRPTPTTLKVATATTAVNILILWNAQPTTFLSLVVMIMKT